MSLWRKVENCLDNYKVKIKLQILYVFCVLLPLIITDGAIIYTVIQSEETERFHNMENAASAVQYAFISKVDSTATTAKNIYRNKYIDQFLETEYESPLDYVTKYQKFVKDTLFDNGFGDSSLLTMYADNNTIVNGGIYGTISSIKNTEWYKYLQDSGEEQVLYAYYDNSRYPVVDSKRKLVLVRKLNFYRLNKEKVLKIELNYSNLVQTLIKMSYDVPIYICQGDTILMSNKGHSSIGQPFDTISSSDKIGFTKSMNLYGLDLQIHVLEPRDNILSDIANNIPVILLLILVNILLPLLLMKAINGSFTKRLRELSEVFGCVDDEKLTEIKTVRGKDEIGALMRNYNKMVNRTNQLIQIVYKNKLKEQEMDIARQNAELLALHSQINPHFLFNALESIRMHSILKHELETAEMVEKLAIMERQNVDWGNDSVEVEKEMEFVKAYLDLQKYRFGDRLNFELEIEEECNGMKIPKLTVVTFVENACIHGIESKMTPGWVFVRAFVTNGNLCLEIEDTGIGMEESKLNELHEKMEHANISNLKEKGRVGIINACLRLKMVTKNEVHFLLEGEEGAGIMVQIQIPLAYV